MTMRQITRTLLLVLGACGAVTVVARAQELPEGVTKEMIEEGGTIYGGAGLCHACHGQQGKGIPNLGADLSDDDWIHSDGSLEGIIATITNGVSGDKSTVGTTMPPKGGSAISDGQIKAVAAYVWSLSRGGK
jgi:mono/diheme cytochrome c family protein